MDAVSAWWPDQPRIQLLEHSSLELAVARGAAYYGLVRRGLGRRIGGGAARAWYVGLDAGAQEGTEQPVLCLIPRGFEEGQSAKVTGRTFRLAVGQPVQFPLYATTADRIDAPGAVVPLAEDMKALPPLHTLLKSNDPKVRELPVHLEAGLTEIGTLELSLVSEAGDERWRLEFELRGTGGSGPLAITESMPPRFAEAREAIDRIYGHKPLPVGPKDVKALWRTMEKTLGPRETWRVPVLRELWSAMASGVGKRRRSADHERVAFSMLGYCLRPGFGYPLDGWRCEQTFRLFQESVTAHGEKAVWTEFWVLWRRIAGGLTPEAQEAIWSYLAPHLERRVPPQTGKLPKLKGVQPEGLDEMVRAAAALEHLDPEEKLELGGVDLRAPARGEAHRWALGVEPGTAGRAGAHLRQQPPRGPGGRGLGVGGAAAGARPGEAGRSAVRGGPAGADDRRSHPRPARRAARARGAGAAGGEGPRDLAHAGHRGRLPGGRGRGARPGRHAARGSQAVRGDLPSRLRSLRPSSSPHSSRDGAHSNLRERCMGGDLEGCGAHLGASGDDAVRQAEFTAIDASLGSACEAESARACNHQGRLWTYFGPEEELPWEKIASAYQRACQLESSEGCFRLAELHEAELGVPEGSNEALRLYEDACRLGDRMGAAERGPAPDAADGRRTGPEATRLPGAPVPRRIGPGHHPRGHHPGPQINSCYERELARREDLEGKSGSSSRSCRSVWDEPRASG